MKVLKELILIREGREKKGKSIDKSNDLIESLILIRFLKKVITLIEEGEYECICDAMDNVVAEDEQKYGKMRRANYPKFYDWIEKIGTELSSDGKYGIYSPWNVPEGDQEGADFRVNEIGIFIKELTPSKFIKKLILARRKLREGEDFICNAFSMKSNLKIERKYPVFVKWIIEEGVKLSVKHNSMSVYTFGKSWTVVGENHTEFRIKKLDKFINSLL